MRRSTLIVLLIIFTILILVGFLITDPGLGEQMLIDLGLKESVRKGYILSGLVEAQVTILSNENGGRLLDIFTSEGAQVRHGEELAIFDISLAQLQLEAAEAQLAFARAQLELVEGEPREVDVAVAEAAVAQAQVVKEGALLALEDARESQPESLREERVAVAQASVDKAEANLLIAEADLEELLEGSSLARVETVLAAVDSAEAEIARVERLIENQKMTAPGGGVVQDIFLLPGEFALPGQPILSIAEIDEVEVTVYVPESDLNWIHLGDIVEVRFDAYPLREYAGVVIHVSDQAAFTPRNIQTPDERVILVYPATVRIANPAGDLKPGLSVDVIFGGES